MTPEEYWADFLGVSIRSLNAAGVQLIPHSGLQGYWGSWLFYRDGCCKVSVPQSLHAEYRERLSPLIENNRTDIDSLRAMFDERAQQSIGPAYHGSLRKVDFSPCNHSTVCQISFEEALPLSESGDKPGWTDSDPQNAKYYFGAFVGSSLVAISNYRPHRGLIESPGLYTHPDYRGQGYGKCVLSAALAHGIDAGLTLIDYQTLCSNHAAIKAAESLGVRPFAGHLAIRFKAENTAPATG
jgi:GNAT superfamily N-acetyltransferase